MFSFEIMRSLSLFGDTIFLGKHFAGVWSWSLEVYTAKGVAMVSPPTKLSPGWLVVMGEYLQTTTVRAVLSARWQSITFHLGRVHGCLILCAKSRASHVRALERGVHNALGIMQPQTEEGQGTAHNCPGYAGPAPDGVSYSEHLARNNID